MKEEQPTLELEHITEQSVVKQESGTVSIAAIIDKLSSTPSLTLESITVLERLVALQERQDAQRRKELFDAALLRVQRAAPRILQNGVMVRRSRDGKDGGTIKFATREDVDAVMRPIYQPEGFTVTWDGPKLPTGHIDVIGRFSCHGHTEERHWVCSPDDSGGKTPPQATSSTIAYGKRQISKMMWDIVEEGKDQNGASRKEDVTPISQSQADTLRTLLGDMPNPQAAFKRMYELYNITRLEDMLLADLDDAHKRIRSAKEAR